MNDERQDSDDVLDRRLREAVAYIDDNGFTARVLAKLPAPQQQRNPLRSVILAGATILACILTYVLSDGGRLVTAGMIRATYLPTLWILLGSAAVAVLVTIGGTAAAVVKNRND